MAVNVISPTLSFLSHNTTGWSDQKADVLQTICKSHNITIGAIQEHMQLPQNLYRIQSMFSDYEFFTIPAYKSNEAIHRGRPSGGLGMFYHKSIEKYVHHITVPNSRRVHGMSVDLPDHKLLIVNVYFPNDPRTNNFDDSELIRTFEDINFILNLLNNEQKLIILGDFNTDLQRNTYFVNSVKDFLRENELVSTWSKFQIDFTYCQAISRNMQVRHVFSTIDHFFVKDEYLENCVDGSVLHIGENISNHDIIYLKINCPHQRTSYENPIPTKINVPNWKHATPDQLQSYKNDLYERLSNIFVPDTSLFCRNPHCQDDDHKLNIDEYATQLLTAMDKSVMDNIPKCCSQLGQNSTPGWREYVDPIKQNMLFWRSIWISAGKPLNTELHRIYRRLRCQYIYAIRRVRKQEQEIRNNNFIQAAARGDVNNILKSLKSQRRPKSGLSNNIDNVQGSDEISEHFRGLYSDIYNTHTDENSLIQIRNSIDQNIFRDDLACLNTITPELVMKLMKKLNCGKNDPAFNFKSDAFINSREILAVPLANLFKAFLTHGYISNIFLQCSLTPIVKNNRKSKSQSSNYRLIAISSIILKIIDLLILHLFSPDLKVDSLQFGFQTNSSTDLCSWTLRESVNYFVNRGSPVYCCMLDMTKAFDNVKLDLLFTKIRKRLPDLFVRILLYSYMKQTCIVKWGTSKSNSFTIGNGVRQGAVISPVLFNVYMNDLFDILRESGLGCDIDGFFYGCIGYADDFCLLSPTRSGLQQMVNIVSDYCNTHGITISTNEDLSKSKTKCLIFNYKEHVENVKLYDVALPWVDSHIHLGHTIHRDESTSYDILKNRGELISNIHGLYQELGNVHPDVFLILVQIYFTSFYGAVLWDLDSPSAKKLYTTWNIMIRNAFNLPYATHRYILRFLSKRPSLQVSLCNRFRNFCSRIQCSDKPEVLHLFLRQKDDCRSYFGKNYTNIISRRKDYTINYEMPPGCEWRIPLIRDLVQIRYNANTLTDFTQEETWDMLVYACCS